MKMRGSKKVKDIIQRLCGGTFFTLIFEVRKKVEKSEYARLLHEKKISDADCLRDLFRVVKPSFMEESEEVFKKAAAEYRFCKSSNAFNEQLDDEVLEKFNKRVRENYRDPLMLMDRFVMTYVDFDKRQFLCCSLLELIESDESISYDAFFFCDVNGHPMTKYELCQTKSITTAGLLLGIWHYVIMQRTDNSVGEETVTSWYAESGKKHVLVFRSDVFGRAKRKISIDSYSGTGVGGKQLPKYKELPNNKISDNFLRYMEKAYDKYSKMKTLLYRDDPRPFYDFYVCNGILERVRERRGRLSYMKPSGYVQEFNAVTLTEKYKFSIITGTGGLGKSMMMRHLFLSAIENYSTLEKLPLFIPLKDYTLAQRDLVAYIYEKFSILASGVTEEELVQVLVSGKCLLLFDGLDEINSAYRNDFERKLEVFGDKYSDCCFVISSRPYSDFISLSRYKVLELQLFTKKQAVKLIEKLDFRQDLPGIKEKFLEQLKGKLFEEHRDFTANPLLLTIMLMTFEQIAEIPDKMHIFYQEAYLALAKRHDASKGAYKREMLTGLSTDRFRDIFEEFCARTYKEELFEMQDQDIKRHFEATVAHSRYLEEKDIPVGAFINDATIGLCLLYYENSCYNFTHRSFQEYFCACFFARQKDRGIEKIGEFFETRGARAHSDKTFAMMYDMEPGKVEEFIFIPYIKRLLMECREKEGYLTFLEKIYPTINYFEGDVVYDEDIENVRNSFLYSFIVKTYSIERAIDGINLEPYDEFLGREYTYLDKEDEYGQEDITAIDEISEEAIKQFGKPPVYGKMFCAVMSQVLEDRDYFSVIIGQMSDDKVPIKREFNDLCKLLPALIERHRVKGDDLFDYF